MLCSDQQTFVAAYSFDSSSTLRENGAICRFMAMDKLAFNFYCCDTDKEDRDAIKMRGPVSLPGLDRQKQQCGGGSTATSSQIYKSIMQIPLRSRVLLV